MPLLEVKDMSHSFGGLKAVSNYNLSLESGQISGLIGPNGAGKTTIFNLITGIYKPDEGEVRLAGTNVVGQRSNQIAALGIGRTFQEMRLWRHMTVLSMSKWPAIPSSLMVCSVLSWTVPNGGEKRKPQLSWP
jgi:branched-chain amino acid transport system ATP-binding protein